MFNSILTSTANITPGEFLTCTVISLVFGIIIALIHSFKNEYSKNMLLSLVILPVIVQTVIMLVNGNVGTGIAVMGAFSLVRFRSSQGNAREISSILLSSVVGLAMSLGYVGISAVLILAVGFATVIVTVTGLADSTRGKSVLHITIPENLDYTGLFDDLFMNYTTMSELHKVKTSNMGSLYELSYYIIFKKGVNEKEFLDAIRCRNGNLNITLGRATTSKEDL